MQAADRSDLVGRRQTNGGHSTYTPTQLFFLTRLQSLIAHREEQSTDGDGASRARLPDKALYSTYCDLIDLGLGDEAREEIRRHRQTQRS